MDFESQIEIINQNTSEEDKRRIHFKSLRNFIYHHNYSKKGKIKATEQLEEYVKLLELQNYSFTEEQSKAAYDFYIGPLAQNYYSRYLNFKCAFSTIVELLIFVLPMGFVWLIFHSKILVIGCLGWYLIHWINYIRKYHNKKIYGYRY